MINEDTLDIEAAVNGIVRLAEAGRNRPRHHPLNGPCQGDG